MQRLIIIICAFVAADGSYGECVPTPCYGERIRVAECQPLSELPKDAEVIRRGLVKSRDAERILAATKGVVLRGKVGRSLPLSQCGEPDRTRNDKAPVLRSYLVLDATCDAFSIGYSTEGFISEPCCDTLPVDTAECLLSLETMSPMPNWAEREWNPQNR